MILYNSVRVAAVEEVAEAEELALHLNLRAIRQVTVTAHILLTVRPPGAVAAVVAADVDPVPSQPPSVLAEAKEDVAATYVYIVLPLLLRLPLALIRPTVRLFQMNLRLNRNLAMNPIL